MALTGDSTERTDTRVMQAIYRVELRRNWPAYSWAKQMDVFIDCSEEAGKAASR